MTLLLFLNPEENFELLEKVLDSRSLRNTPRQIYNYETFLPLDATREKIVTLKNAKNVYSQATGTTKHVTMLCAVSAASFPVSPMINGFPGGHTLSKVLMVHCTVRVILGGLILSCSFNGRRKIFQ